MSDPRELLTLEQQELYDGVLKECRQDGEKAVAVRDLGQLIEGAGDRGKAVPGLGEYAPAHQLRQ